MVLVAKRFERRPIESRVGAFSAGRTVDLKARRVEVNQGLDLTGECGNYWCMFVK